MQYTGDKDDSVLTYGDDNDSTASSGGIFTISGDKDDSDQVFSDLESNDKDNNNPEDENKEKVVSEVLKPKLGTKSSNNKKLDKGIDDDSLSFDDEADVVEVQEKEIFDISVLRTMNISQLLELASGLEIPNRDTMNAYELRNAIIYSKADSCQIFTTGYVEINHANNFAFIRSSQYNYAARPDDVYISSSQVRKLNLRPGDKISGVIRLPSRKSSDSRRVERYCALIKATNINDFPIEDHRCVTYFDDLTPVHPDKKINLEIEDDENGSDDVSMRLMDIIAPIGFGQRSLIVAPPRTGKTVLLQKIANAISKNHPDAELIVLLIDERPEEVTEMRRSVKGEVVSSTFDEQASRHVQVANMVINKAKRLVEHHKKDVIILLDSITRLARAYNTIAPASGKVLTGGIDAQALQKPKRFFGAARNIEEGGSITIISTALVETGSKMDDIIFEEFKGTGNSELNLERKLAERRIYPAANVVSSGTRREELLIDKENLGRINVLRRLLASMVSNSNNSIEAAEFLHEKLRKTKNNADFFQSMNNNKNN